MEEDFYPDFKSPSDSRWVLFMLTSVSCPTLLILLADNGLLMGAEMLMMTLGKSSLGPTRPISLCLRLLCKCHSAIAEASSHLQLRGIEPKVRSFASA